MATAYFQNSDQQSANHYPTHSVNYDPTEDIGADDGVWFRDIDPLCRATSIRPPTPLMSDNIVPLFHPN